MNISILIGTYGSEEWRELALTRAIPTAEKQDAFEIIATHDSFGTISSVRNELAQCAAGDWLCFLDADDELAHGYIRWMQTAHAENPAPKTLFTPAVSYVKQGRRRPPRFWPAIPLERANWLVIGTVIERDFFLEVGGFLGEPHGLEDWSLWGRCHKAGAQIVKVPRAVYIAHYNPDSKHHAFQRDRAEYAAWYERTKALIADA